MNERAYALGPSLHDWAREEWEVEEMAKEREIESCAVDFHQWENFSYCDQSPRTRHELDDKMNRALDRIFDRAGDSERFRSLLFNTYCSNDHLREFRDFIGNALFSVYQQDWQDGKAE